MKEFLPMFIVPIFFVVLGTIFSQGKGVSLIAGYNTLSEEEKEHYKEYDEKALSRFMGIFCHVMAIQVFIMTASFVYSVFWLEAASILAIVGTIFGGMFYMNKR